MWGLRDRLKICSRCHSALAWPVLLLQLSGSLPRSHALITCEPCCWRGNTCGLAAVKFGRSSVAQESYCARHSTDTVPIQHKYWQPLQAVAAHERAKRSVISAPGGSADLLQDWPAIWQTVHCLSVPSVPASPTCTQRRQDGGTAKPVSAAITATKMPTGTCTASAQRPAALSPVCTAQTSSACWVRVQPEDLHRSHAALSMEPVQDFQLYPWPACAAGSGCAHCAERTRQEQPRMRSSTAAAPGDL